jgi:hypothetical protein
MVYVFCHNARVNLIVILMTYVCYLYSINCPTVICLPSILLFIYGETPLVNCGPRSNFLYIAITIYYFSCLFTFLHTITFYHSIRSILCLQQIGEIDNLIVSWGKVLGCVVYRFHVAAGEKLHADKHLSGAIVWSVAKLASINLLKFVFLLLVRLNLGFTTEGNLLLCSSYLPLGVPNWVLNTHYQCTR